MINKQLPLTDIHRHLDGNIRPETILSLAQQHNIILPANEIESLRPHVQVSRFFTKIRLGSRRFS